MTLLQQFLLVGLAPLGFLALAFQLWRARAAQPRLYRRWILALLAAAIGASSLMSYYLGVNFDPAVPYTWRVVAAHAFNLQGLLILLATVTQLSVVAERRWAMVVVAALLWLAALLLSPEIWRFRPPNFIFFDRSVRYYDLWAGIYVASWLTPLFLAIRASGQTFSRLPNSLFRSQVYMLWLGLVLWLIGGGLALARLSYQLVVQEAGALVQLLGAAIVVLGLVRRQLPDVRTPLVLWQARLSGAAYIFFISWLLLVVVRRTDIGDEVTRRGLGLVAVAAGFTVLVVVGRRLARWLAQGARRPATPRPWASSVTDMAVVNALEPLEINTLVETRVARDLDRAEAWLFRSSDGPGGRLVLHPVHENGRPPGPVDLAADSPLAHYLRSQSQPLVSYDIAASAAFQSLADEERQMLADWGRVIFMPLHAGRRLVGLLALGPKRSGEAYDEDDFGALRRLARQVALPLRHAQDLATLRQVGDFVADQNRALAHHNQWLQPQATLYGHFIDLISPDLRRPLDQLDAAWRRIEADLAADLAAEAPPAVAELNAALDDLRDSLDHLITSAPRILNQARLNLVSVQLDDVARQVMERLTAMADARQVTVSLESATHLPPVLGDADRLAEAVRYVVHNGIKFNKIGGQVDLVCGVVGNEVYLRVSDNGVGIAAERQADLWTRLARRPAGRDLESNGEHGASGVPDIGLGLPLAYHIVRAHGGRMTVESKHGSGSRFTLYLPLADMVEGVTDV